MTRSVRLTLVRHGETAGQSSIRYYGATDVALSALGEEQMRRAGAALARERFDVVWSSGLRRSRDGAALVARHQLAPRAVAAFDEVHFGRWEGWTREEIASRDAEQFGQWQRDPEHFVYPDGECRQAFHRRVASGLAAVLAEPAAHNVLLVLHRGVIALILTELLQLSAAERRGLAIDLGSIHVIVGSGRQWRAEVLNRVDHLDAIGAGGEVRA
jgi:broad specificity phosphatase PhoE